MSCKAWISIPIFAIIAFITSCDQARDEVYILPDNFKGAVYIDFDSMNGVSIQPNSNRKLEFNIPAHGVLKVKGKLQQGWRQFDVIDANGDTIKQLRTLKEIKSIDKNDLKNYVFDMGYADDLWFNVGSVRERDSLLTVLNSIVR